MGDLSGECDTCDILPEETKSFIIGNSEDCEFCIDSEEISKF
jgi:hypothetical protein